jgi:uncharacterized protein
MPRCLFVTDLHGLIPRYDKLKRIIGEEKPDAVFMGGDLLPTGMTQFSNSGSVFQNFISDYMIPSFLELKSTLGQSYPRVFLILGNDDSRNEEKSVLEGVEAGCWGYIHNKRVTFGDYQIFGYSYVPPTPFLLKDWERYDVSRFVDAGCVSPEEGVRSIPVSNYDIKYATIQNDLDQLAADADFERSIFLFHSPPHKTLLDRAALDGRMIDHVPLDVHIGSIAIRRFIEKKQPLLTLHGHVHESARLTGSWKDKIGKTIMLSAAHDGPELALVRLELNTPETATREIL